MTLLFSVYEVDKTQGSGGTGTCVETIAGKLFWQVGRLGLFRCARRIRSTVLSSSRSLHSQLIIVDFGVTALTTIVLSYLQMWWTKARVEFDFSSNVNALIYRQVIIRS